MSTSRPPMLFAPGATTQAAYAPGRGQRLPAVDERLVAPESHAEIVDGVVHRTMGSNQPHGTRHFEATHVFAGALAEGYEGAVDMLTRADEDTDAAPDISVFPSGVDPETGGRRLEEIAFEVLDTERMSHATRKVEKLAARGVRRLFAIRVAERRVYEWDRAHGDWTELNPDATLTDPCFRVPVPVRAFVDRVLADDTVAAALLAVKNRVLEKALTERQRAGAVRARREVLVTLLEARSPLTRSQRARVADCDDEATLAAWFKRAVAGEGAAAILGA
ncbi:MAG: Uma2 family endonuclease [Polyangiales bacterium]